MAYAHHERLSALDSSFLAIEDGRAHMHIGSVAIFDAEPLLREGGGLDFERILDFIDAQLHKVPRFRQKLVWVPGFRQPVWVDDSSFNLRFHVRHTALPPPGDVRLLKRLAGRILSQEFDRGKPLWENWLVEGLEGSRFAVVTKLHHCMADGISSVGMGNVLVGPDAGYRPDVRSAWIPRPPPSGTRLFLDELRHRASAPWALLNALRQTRREATSGGGLGTLVENVSSAVVGAARTPLDVDVGPHRRFDWTRFPLEEVRTIGARAGGTVNDVVLAVASGALRGFLRRRGVSVADLDFRAAVPVSVRGVDECDTLGNRVSGMLARLPLDEKDPWTRLLRVVETTHEVKGSGQARAGDLLGRAADLLPPQLLWPLFRRGARSSVANIVITNVPGPRVPVYLLGARQLECYPVVPLAPNQALAFALFSYDGGLYWGLNSDWDAVPDLHDLVGDLDAGLAELAAAALPLRRAAPAATERSA